MKKAFFELQSNPPSLPLHCAQIARTAMRGNSVQFWTPDLWFSGRRGGGVQVPPQKPPV